MFLGMDEQVVLLQVVDGATSILAAFYLEEIASLERRAGSGMALSRYSLWWHWIWMGIVDSSESRQIGELKSLAMGGLALRSLASERSMGMKSRELQRMPESLVEWIVLLVCVANNHRDQGDHPVAGLEMSSWAVS